MSKKRKILSSDSDDNYNREDDDIGMHKVYWSQKNNLLMVSPHMRIIYVDRLGLFCSYAIKASLCPSPLLVKPN